MSLAVTVAAGVLLAAAKKTTTTSSGSATFLIVLVLIALAGYFLFLRPQQQKARRQRALQSEIEVGDEVLTVGGIVGTVLAIDTQRVTILTGVDADGSPVPGQPPTRMVLVRNAIARKIEPVVEPTQDESEEPGSVNGVHPGYGGVPEDDDHAGDGVESPESSKDADGGDAEASDGGKQ